MTDLNNSRTTSRFRPLYALLFLLIICCLAWVAVQLVERAPSGFAKIAALAENVNDSQQSILDFAEEPKQIALDANTTYLEAGEITTLTWPESEDTGSYFFSYGCVDGVSIDIQDGNGPQTVACDTAYNLGSNTQVELAIYSEKDRYADLEYAIDFVRDGKTASAAQGSETITVVNSTISNLFADNTIDVEPTVPVVPSVEPQIPPPVVAGTATIETEVAIETPVKPAVSPSHEPQYVIPTSDPNGTTDLGIRFIATGNIIGDTFFAENIIKDHKGAVQFEVKNLGTKSSGIWTYTLALPSGRTYTSPFQAVLKPNERAVITVGFPTPDINDHTFTVAVDESTDTVAINDRFTQVVAFVN